MSSFDDAEVALRSARLMLAAGDMRGAGNRAYYAVFYAVRVALEAVELDAFALKTHDGLRRMFDLHLVRTGKVDMEAGKLFNDVQQTRWSADYTSDLPSVQEIKQAIEKAEAFVAACRSSLKPKP